MRRNPDYDFDHKHEPRKAPPHESPEDFVDVGLKHPPEPGQAPSAAE